MIKAAAQRVLRALGYELARFPARASLVGVLGHARAAGVAPATVIDVGAAYGDFARACLGQFPDAACLLVEPVEEFDPWLARLAAGRPRVKHLRAAAAPRRGDIMLNVHADLVGSSLHAEAEGPAVDGTSRRVPGVPLDELVREAGAGGSYLVKVDVQGAELDVLAGATGILESADMVILEVSFLPFFVGAPLAPEVIAFMAARGYVPYDVFGLSHRPLDGALSQADVAFVPEASPLRRDHRFATPEQRQALTRRLRRG